MRCSRDKNRQGLSLVEVAVSSLLVGTVIVGSLAMLGASIRTQTAAVDLVNGPMLAESLLAEIMSMPYDDPEDGGSTRGNDSGESGSNRTDFDDVDDYDGWASTDIQDRLGNVLPQYAGWTRSATVTWANLVDGSEVVASSTGLKRIIVTVTSPDATVTTRFGLRYQAGSLEQAPSIDTTVVAQIEATLAVGAAIESRATTNLLNHVEDPNP